MFLKFNERCTVEFIFRRQTNEYTCTVSSLQPLNICNKHIELMLFHSKQRKHLSPTVKENKGDTKLLIAVTNTHKCVYETKSILISMIKQTKS